MLNLNELWRKLRNEKRADPDQLVIDYRTVFGTPSGLRVLHDLEVKTIFSRSAFPRSKPIDVNILIEQEAQRSMFVYILKQIEREPDKKAKEVNNG